MEREYAEYLLKKTQEDYNLIAEDFSNTRSFVPQEIQEWILKFILPGDKILDLGCGNGRFFEVFKNIEIDYFGVDISEKLIEIAKSKYSQGKFIVSPALNLPFPEDFFDKVINFAVFHHVPSEEFRLQFLKEIKRVLKPKGLLVLTIWNLNPLEMILIGKRERVLSFFKSSILKILGKSKLDFKDFFIPWRDVCQRYVHYFSRNELEKLAKKSDFKIKEIGISKSQKTKESNIYLIAEK